MFSWICPQCGRDVPPSKTDCPYCAEQAAALAAAGQVPAGNPPPEQQQAAPWQQSAPGYAAPPNWPPQPPPQYAQQPPQAPPQYGQPQYPPPQYPPQPAYTPPQQPHPPQPAHAWAPPPARSAPPTWAVALGFAAVLLLIGGGIWYFLLRAPGPGSASAKTASASSAPAAAASADAAKGAANPYQKYVEVVGIRIYQQDKKPMVKFVVVNHSDAEIDNLQANVRLWASTSRSEEDPVGSFNFRLPEIGANASKDVSEPLKTKMKMYELPDWQNTTAQVEITSPKE